jgi:ParB family chromosome partitioning protein
MNVKSVASEQPRAKPGSAGRKASKPVVGAGAEVPIDKIDVGKRVRPVDLIYAAWIGGEMKDKGQLQPIEIRPYGNAGRFKLTMGAHRLVGARNVGWDKIRAEICPCSDDEALLREIDENLIRFDLNALDRATSLAHRQMVYLKLHPETAQGKAGAEARWHAVDKPSFASETAERLRVSDRDIRRAIARHNKIAPDVRDKIAGSWIADHGGQLDALVRVGEDEQRHAVRLMLQEAHPARSVAAAIKLIRGDLDTPLPLDDQQYLKLCSAWAKAGAKARRQFITYLRQAGALDAPKADAPAKVAA